MKYHRYFLSFLENRKFIYKAKIITVMTYIITASDSFNKKIHAFY